MLTVLPMFVQVGYKMSNLSFLYRKVLFVCLHSCVEAQNEASVVRWQEFVNKQS